MHERPYLLLRLGSPIDYNVFPLLLVPDLEGKAINFRERKSVIESCVVQRTR